MKSETELNFPQLEAVAGNLQELGALSSASETHGLLSAFLCAQPNSLFKHWLALLFDAIDVPKDKVKNNYQVLETLYNASKNHLADDAYIFQFILPDENASLAKRVEALSQWCGGFILGLGLSGMNIEKFGEDVKDVINDFKAISQVEIPKKAGKEEQLDFTEIYEYARLAVIMIYQDNSFANSLN